MGAIPVYFCLPERFWRADFPQGPGENWPGFMLGLYAWTLQSYLWLGDRYPCKLVNHLPDSGIVLIHRNALRAFSTPVRPHPQRLLICFQGDLSPYPYAQIQLVQNPCQPGYFLPHWPQPGLIPRHPDRGDRFETVAFFGHHKNLAALGDDWSDRLSKLSLRWQPRISSNPWDQLDGVHPRWHDYSDVDAVVAVRSFDRWEHWRAQNYTHKPATKLYNGWLAGVPPVLGVESAYRAERRNPYDYFEIGSVAELLGTLQRLKQDPSLRRAIVRQGQLRAASVRPEAICQRWLHFFQTIAEPAYERWVSQPNWKRWATVQNGFLETGLSRLEHKLRSKVPLP